MTIRDYDPAREEWLTPRILRIPHVFAKKMSRGDCHLYDEIVSEGNYTLFRCLACYDPSVTGRNGVPASFASYAYGSVRLALCRFLPRKFAQRKFESLDPGCEPAITPRCDLEEKEDFQAVLRKIPRGQARLLRMKYVEGLRYSDMAQILGYSRELVRQRTMAARNALKEKLAS